MERDIFVRYDNTDTTSKEFESMSELYNDYQENKKSNIDIDYLILHDSEIFARNYNTWYNLIRDYGENMGEIITGYLNDNGNFTIINFED